MLRLPTSIRLASRSPLSSTDRLASPLCLVLSSCTLISRACLHFRAVNVASKLAPSSGRLYVINMA